MHMKLGQPRLDGPKKFNVIVSVEIFGKAALNTHLRGALLNRLYGLGKQRICGMKIGIGRVWPSAESAKSAADDTDVGEIQISVQHVGDAVPARAAAKPVRDLPQSQKLVPFDCPQRTPPFRSASVPAMGFAQFA